jgi:hypothetical protein
MSSRPCRVPLGIVDVNQTGCVGPFEPRSRKMLAYDYPLLGVFWSLAFLFMFLVVGFIVIYTLIDNFRRADHRGAAKAGWALLIIMFPLLGALVYILLRPEMTNPPLRPAA